MFLRFLLALVQSPLSPCLCSVVLVLVVLVPPFLVLGVILIDLEPYNMIQMPTSLAI